MGQPPPPPLPRPTSHSHTSTPQASFPARYPPQPATARPPPLLPATVRGAWMSSSSSSVVVYNVLQGTGLVSIENAYPVRDEIKKRGGKFLRDGCGEILQQNVWIIRTPSEDHARTTAKALKKHPRAQGHSAKVRMKFGCCGVVRS